MSKYIADSIRNNLRFVTKSLTKPQSKAVSEIMRGIFVENTTILRHIVPKTEKLIKKQAEKYSYHLGKIQLKEKIDEVAFKKIKGHIKRKTIIAYDLTDISKESSVKIEKLSRVFDGSKRISTNGFTLHGVGINNTLVKLEIHDSAEKTLNQTRRKIVEEISRNTNKKGIWVFDRGNDDKNFFKFLRHNVKVDFVLRLRDNRNVVIKKTGAIEKIKNIKPGKYKVFMTNKYNTDADLSHEYLLVIQNHLDGKPPIRLLSNLSHKTYSKQQIVKIYLQRWGVETMFRQIKTKFLLEKIRVLNFQKFENLVALIQLASVITASIYLSILQSTTMWIAGTLAAYRHFLKNRALTLNIDSFIKFISVSLKPIVFRSVKKTNQQALFEVP